MSVLLILSFSPYLRSALGGDPTKAITVNNHLVHFYSCPLARLYMCTPVLVCSCSCVLLYLCTTTLDKHRGSFLPHGDHKATTVFSAQLSHSDSKRKLNRHRSLSLKFTITRGFNKQLPKVLLYPQLFIFIVQITPSG